MTLSQAIHIAYSRYQPGQKPLTILGSLELDLARAIVATWSAECNDCRRQNMAPLHNAERLARKALDAYLAETSDYLPAYCS